MPASWVGETPVGALGACLVYAGRITVPVCLREPIRRLRYSHRRQPDSPVLRAATADVRLLAMWLMDVWCPWKLFEPLDVLSALIDWRAFPASREEEDALRQYE